MKENFSIKIKNDLKHSQKTIRRLDQKGKEIDRIDFGKKGKFSGGSFYRFTTDQENDPVDTYCEVDTDGSLTFSPKSLTEWRKIKLKVRKIKDTNDETVNVTIGEDRTVI
jgi:hypothetical protein